VKHLAAGTSAAKTAILLAALATSMLPSFAEPLERGMMREQSFCAAQAKKVTDADDVSACLDRYNAKDRRCFDIRPDLDSTEGSVRKDGHEISKACDHAKEHRGPMTADKRDEVLLRYGLQPGPHPDYQIDHLIPLCLGGSDDFANLWPQPRKSIVSKWNAEAKDRLEQVMCAMACDGQFDLPTAQEELVRDWIAAYRKYYGSH
jgi:hypothetical protein